MKQNGKTIVPRNKNMNEYLVSLGHKLHKDKREKKRVIDKLKREQYDE